MEFCITELADDDNIFASALKDFKFDFNNLQGNSEDAKFWLGECADYAEFRFCDACWELIRQHIEQNKERLLIEHSPETTIVQIDLNGNIVKEYASPADVREALQRDNLTSVYNVLEGKQKHAYSYIWRYKKDLVEKKQQDKNGQLNIDFDN